MRQEDLVEYLERQPFSPIRIYLSTGVFFDIRQPQMASVNRSTLTLGFPIEGESQRYVAITLVHIVWLEVLLPTPPD
jgi:hypothetical protein